MDSRSWRRSARPSCSIRRLLRPARAGVAHPAPSRTRSAEIPRGPNQTRTPTRTPTAAQAQTQTQARTPTTTRAEPIAPRAGMGTAVRVETGGAADAGAADGAAAPGTRAASRAEAVAAESGEQAGRADRTGRAVRGADDLVSSSPRSPASFGLCARNELPFSNPARTSLARVGFQSNTPLLRIESGPDALFACPANATTESGTAGR